MNSRNKTVGCAKARPPNLDFSGSCREPRIVNVEFRVIALIVSRAERSTLFSSSALFGFSSALLPMYGLAASIHQSFERTTPPPIQARAPSRWQATTHARRTRLVVLGVSGDVGRVLFALVPCRTPLRLHHGAHSSNPDLVLEVAGTIWARSGADGHSLGNLILASRLEGAYLLLSSLENVRAFFFLSWISLIHASSTRMKLKPILDALRLRPICAPE